MRVVIQPEGRNVTQAPLGIGGGNSGVNTKITRLMAKITTGHGYTVHTSSGMQTGSCGYSHADVI